MADLMVLMVVYKKAFLHSPLTFGDHQPGQSCWVSGKLVPFYSTFSTHVPVHVGCFIICVITLYSPAKTEGQYHRWNLPVSERSFFWKHIKVSYSQRNCAALLPYLLIMLVEWSHQQRAPGTSLHRPGGPLVCFSLKWPWSRPQLPTFRRIVSAIDKTCCFVYIMLFFYPNFDLARVVTHLLEKNWLSFEIGIQGPTIANISFSYLLYPCDQPGAGDQPVAHQLSESVTKQITRGQISWMEMMAHSVTAEAPNEI